MLSQTIRQMCIIPVACLGWRSCLNLLLALLPTKCVGYCGNGRTCRNNSLEGYWGELKGVISVSLCWKASVNRMEL